MKSYIIIPARLQSTRLPQKLLLNKTGKPLIQHTWENVVNQCADWAKIYIATDSQEIYDVAEDFGANVLKTGPASCGTERMYLVSKELGKGIYINVQGDLPFVNLSAFPEFLLELLYEDCDVIGLHYPVDATKLRTPINKIQFANGYNRTKVVLGQDNNVLYYSRELIPYDAPVYNINVGVYCMDSVSLYRIYTLFKSPIINHTEKLEQLKWLEHGLTIKSTETTPAISIDTQEDYDNFIEMFKEESN